MKPGSLYRNNCSSYEEFAIKQNDIILLISIKGAFVDMSDLTFLLNGSVMKLYWMTSTLLEDFTEIIS